MKNKKMAALFGRTERPERTEKDLEDAFFRIKQVATATYVLAITLIVVVPMIVSGRLLIADVFLSTDDALLWSIIWTSVSLATLAVVNYSTLYILGRKLSGKPGEKTPEYNVMSAEKYSQIELSALWGFLMMIGYYTGCAIWLLLVNTSNPGVFYKTISFGGLLGSLIFPFLLDRFVLSKIGIINYTNLPGNNYAYALVANAPMHLIIGPGGKIRDVGLFGVFDISPDTFAEVVDQKSIEVSKSESTGQSILRYMCGTGVQSLRITFKYQVDIFMVIGTLGYGEEGQIEPEYVQQIRIFILEMLRRHAEETAAVEHGYKILPSTIDGFRLPIHKQRIVDWITENSGGYEFIEAHKQVRLTDVYASLYLGEVYVEDQKGPEIDQIQSNRKHHLEVEGDNATRTIKLEQATKEAKVVSGLDPAVMPHALQQVGGEEAAKTSERILMTQVIVEGVKEALMPFFGFFQNNTKD